MLDQIQDLEQRMETLMRLLERVRRENGELQGTIGRLEHENRTLRQEIESLSQVRDESEQRQTQVRQLESELESVAGRESQIRDRLRLILEKIDSMEQEIGQVHGD